MTKRKRIVRLNDLTPAQRSLVLALIAAQAAADKEALAEYPSRTR